MTDKKKKLETIELHEIVDLSPGFKDDNFPTRVKHRNIVLAVLQDGVKLCYICMDMLHPIVIPHIYIPPWQKNAYNIYLLAEIFYTHVHPWCKERGFSTIITSCQADDTKTTELLKTFGFEPENINLAVMPVK